MIVTVFTDASFDHRTKAAGFAIWIKTDTETLRYAGPFKSDVPDSTAAETLALANGISVAITVLNLSVGDMICAASDCARALDIIKGCGLKGRPSRQLQQARDHVHTLLAERGVALRLKHVKAHRGVSAGPRHAVNEWCDREAKTIMRTQRRLKDAA